MPANHGAQRSARPTRVCLSQRCRWTIRRAIHPNPIFHPFAQPLSHGIHQDVRSLFFKFVPVAQAMVEEIPLLLNAMFYGRKFFPVSDGCCHARFARKSDDGVQMIRHQQTQPAMPDEFFVIMCHRRQYPFANTSLAKLVSAGGNAFDGDEKPTAVQNPLWHGVGNLFANGQIHAMGLASQREREKPKVGRAVPCAPFVRTPANHGAQRSARSTLTTRSTHQSIAAGARNRGG